MSFNFKLQEILDKGDDSLVATSIFLSQKMAILDCTGVDIVSPSQLDLLFSRIPETWDFAQLREIIDASSLSDSLQSQFFQYVNQRLGKEKPNNIDSEKAYTEENEPSISNFSLTITQHQPLHPIRILDKVTEEYKDYLKTEFRAKDPQLKAAL